MIAALNSALCLKLPALSLRNIKRVNGIGQATGQQIYNGRR
jgi:hypothetical protein